MHWSRLLNCNRLREPRTLGVDPARSPWQFDYDRIVFSTAFRRLQDKTQVFPLSGGGDYVRTRLTHSLEVSTVARTLGMEAARTILEKHGDEPIPYGSSAEPRPMRDVLTPADIGAIVANAALAHDLGNPPFGHSGEDAVRHWFSTSPLVAEPRAELERKGLAADFKHWEGNAQGFRILARHELYANEGGFRLTYATLAAFTKYPCGANVLSMDKKLRPLSRKKNGYFQSEKELLAEVADATGLLAGALPGTWCRHPLAFLMEAADDICYRIVDLEDGHRMGRILYESAFAALRAVYPDDKNRVADIPTASARIAYLRARAISVAVKEVSAEFARAEDAIMRGQYEQELISGAACFPQLEQIRDLVRCHVYPDATVLQTEAAGFEVIPGLLDIFWHAVDTTANGGGDLRAGKIMQLLGPHLAGLPPLNKMPVTERLMAVIDLVSGMTDSHALALYRRLKGIVLPT